MPFIWVIVVIILSYIIVAICFGLEFLFDDSMIDVDFLDGLFQDIGEFFNIFSDFNSAGRIVVGIIWLIFTIWSELEIASE